MPRAFIGALGLVKQAAARANTRLGLLDAATARGDRRGGGGGGGGRHDAQFPIDVFQTGSGTSTNMNANEVIATLATRRLGQAGASQRSRQHGPEQQRRDPDGDPRERGARRAARAHPGARAPARGAARQGARGRRGRQDRPHPPDGCDARDAGAGALGLARADRERHRRGSPRWSRACLPSPRAAPRSAPASTRIPSSAPASARRSPT